MANDFVTRFRNAWNVFRNNERSVQPYSTELGVGSGYPPFQHQFSYGTEKSMVAPLYNRIGVDVASMRFNHVRVNEFDQYQGIIKSGLNNCLTVEANKDQTGRNLIQDIVMSLCDEGVVAVVPIDTTTNPRISGSYDILSMRVAKIRQWYPDFVKIRVYNDRTGLHEEIDVPKSTVAIIENPLYAVMNEPNGTLRRLIEKLNILDAIDRQSGSGKLDIIIQFPWTIRSEDRQQKAENRRQQLSDQLKDSQYGVAYADATEKIIQLNRPAENQMLTQVEYLTRMLFSQLGMSEGVFDGTASDEEILNYYNRSIEPIGSAVADAMHRSFLTSTGRTQGQAVRMIRDPFRYIAPKDLPEFTDKFTRNEVLSSNEVRSVVGLHPSSDPKADELRNKNLNQQEEKPMPDAEAQNNQNGRSESKNVKVNA